MNPTIPNPESAIIVPESIENSTVNTQSPNSLRMDLETRENKTTSSSGGSDNSDADDARAQLSLVGGDDSASTSQVSATQQIPIVNDDDEITVDDSVFIKKVESIIENNKKDPSAQVHGIASVQAEYLLKTFNYKMKAMKDE